MNTNNFARLTNTLQQADLQSEAVVNIAFAVDQNYLKPCGICLNSIVKNNPNIRIDFYIFVDHFNDFGFRQIVAENSNIRIFVYTLNCEYFNTLQVNYHFSTAMYYRLIIAETLKDTVKQITYLDADIICDNNLQPLIGLDLAKNIIGAVKDDSFNSEYCTKLGMNSASQYFNSGVLVINTHAWVAFNVFDKFRSIINSRKYEYPDQDVLNILLSEHTVFLDKSFNDLHQEQNNKSMFVHYVSSPKPWTLAAEANTRYLSYYACSPWKDIALDLPRSYRDARKLAEKCFKNVQLFAGLKWYLIYLVKKFKLNII